MRGRRGQFQCPFGQPAAIAVFGSKAKGMGLVAVDDDKILTQPKLTLARAVGALEEVDQGGGDLQPLTGGEGGRVHLALQGDMGDSGCGRCKAAVHSQAQDGG